MVYQPRLAFRVQHPETWLLHLRSHTTTGTSPSDNPTSMKPDPKRHTLEQASVAPEPPEIVTLHVQKFG